MEDWKEYFMEIMGGVERKVVREGRRGRKGQEKEDIDLEEVRRASRKLKERKARERMVYRMKYGNTVEKKRINGHGKYVGEGKSGQNNGKEVK